MANENLREIVNQKIEAIKKAYATFRTKSNDYVFNALCIKYSIYKNPELNLSEDMLANAIVDGTNDGGVDFFLADPNSDCATNLIIGQSKLYNVITLEDVKNASRKMFDFYNKMRNEDYSDIREEIVHKFSSVFSEVGEESNIKFRLYTSAPRNSIKTKSIDKLVKDEFEDDRFTLEVYFLDDIVEEIKDAESRRPTVESGTLELDSPNNFLAYGDDDAVIVNVSARSLKQLYVDHGVNLLSKNLRYFIKGKTGVNAVNADVEKTIKDAPYEFWYKNNGITIICKRYDISGKVLKLKDFSIVNGGQTTFLIYQYGPSKDVEDFFISCKVICALGDTEEERENFVLEVAKATNSQKPIKMSDLKANAPEQLRFCASMKEQGIYYKTKRGSKVPTGYTDDYKNSDLTDVGKLSLAGIFQLPASSRNKPSLMYDDKYYNPTFNSNNGQISKLMRDLLYIDYFFRKIFIPKFDSEVDSEVNDSLVKFGHNARTACIAFISLGARIACGNLDGNEFFALCKKSKSSDDYKERLYPLLKKLDGFDHILNPAISNNFDKVDELLYRVCFDFIVEGSSICDMKKDNAPELTESNYLKKDTNYFEILGNRYMSLKKIFSENQMLYK